MDKYYYFVSQLPMLKFNEKPVIGKDYFLDEAKKWLSLKDLESVLGLNINDFISKKNDLNVLREYKYFERVLREELVLFRKSLYSNIDSKALTVLDLSIMEGNPLDVERKLLLLRWDFIEEKEQGHFFDLELLCLYFLKLQILERLVIFDKEKGTLVFDKLCEVKS